jgi:hypothetical protein
MNADTLSEIPAVERRRAPRQRALLAGVLHEANKTSTWSCMIRNLSEGGARLDIPNAFWVPNEFGIEIKARNTRKTADVVWKDANAIGVSFRPIDNAAGLDAREQLNNLRLERETLRRRISELTE